jgi:hypothetical protein
MWASVRNGRHGPSSARARARARAWRCKTRTADVNAVRDVLRLAVIERLELGQLDAVLLQERREAEQHVAAVTSVGLAEGRERGGRGRDGVIDVFLAGGLDARDDLLGGRVDGVEPARSKGAGKAGARTRTHLVAHGARERTWCRSWRQQTRC